MQLRTLVFLILLSSCAQRAFAQDDYYNPDALNKTPEKLVYLGIASGLENFTGIFGPSIEFNASKKVALYGGVGLGSWGYKMSAGIKYYNKFPFKWAYCLSVSHATGLKNFENTMETQTGSKKVRMDLLPCQTVNLSIQHHWKLGSKHRFHIEGGYAIPLAYEAYTIKDGSALTPSSKLAMKILQPGGLMLGFGFSFAL